MNQSKRRTVYLDFIRIIAIYMVLFTHTGTNGFVLFLVKQTSYFYPFYLFNGILIKSAVPLFFMVSGALLLGKKESNSQLIKRFFKFFCVLIVASIVSYFYQHFRLGKTNFSIKDFLTIFYTKRITAAMWYLYAYLAYILMLPFLRCLAKNMDRRGFEWLFLMYGLISILPMLEFIFSKGVYKHSPDFSFFINCNYLFYPLMGYYIEHRLQSADFTRRRIFLMITASILSITVCSVMTHWKCTIMDHWTERTCQTFFNSLIFIPSCTIFSCLKLFFEKHPPNEKTESLICTVGSSTFGLYLIENICLNETRKIFIWLNTYIPTIWASWIRVFVACVLGCMITMLVKRSSIIKRMI